MEPLKNLTRRSRTRFGLSRRVTELEAEVQECRQLNIRLAELTDLVMELLLPAAERDEERVAELLERYRVSVSEFPPDR